jgi:hypothetical protein
MVTIINKGLRFDGTVNDVRSLLEELTAIRASGIEFSNLISDFIWAMEVELILEYTNETESLYDTEGQVGANR